MKRTTIVLCCLLLVGCQDASMKLLGYCYFNSSYVSSSHPSVGALVSITTETVAIISDCPEQQMGRDRSPRQISGNLITTTGRKIPWSCTTADRRTFSRVTVNGQDFRLRDGNAILVSCKGDQIRMLQIWADHGSVISFNELLRNNKQARDFFLN